MKNIMNVFTSSLALSVAHDIEDEFRYFIENNTSNNLPYHNLYHSLCVMSEVGRMIYILQIILTSLLKKKEIY